MAKTKRNNHVHKYIRTSGKFTFVWKCADMLCKHYIHGSQAYTIIGRASICWECDRQFPLTEEAMQHEMPVCENCRLKTTILVEPLPEGEPPTKQFSAEEMEETRKQLIALGVISK